MAKQNSLLIVGAFAGLLVGLGLGVGVSTLLSAASQDEAADAEGGPGDAPQGLPPANVAVGVALPADAPPMFTLVGRLHEVRRATVSSEVTGRVLTLPVEDGQRVIQGQTVLATVDPVWAELALDEAQAGVGAAQAEMDDAEIELTRLQAMAVSGSAPQRERDEAQARFDRAAADLLRAEAERDRRQTEVERLQVVAPFDGYVVRKHAEAGQWVAPGDPVVELVSRGQIDAMVDVPERYVSRVQMNQSLEIYVEALEEFVVAEVVSVTPDAGNASRTFPVRIRMADQDGRLKAGMSVTVQLPVGEPNGGLIVPANAVNITPEGASVWVALDMGGPMPQAIPVHVNVQYELAAGMVVQPIVVGDEQVPLYPTALVVTQGQERIFMPTQPLMFAPPADLPAEASADENAQATQGG